MALRPSQAMETLCSLAKPWSSRYSAVSRLTVTRSLEATVLCRTLLHFAARYAEERLSSTHAFGYAGAP